VLILDKKVPEHTYAHQLFIDDILNREMVHSIFRENEIDVVFHMAGRIEVGESEKDPSEFWEVNVGGTTILLNAMKKYGVKKIIFSSTAGVYFSGSIPIVEDECTSNNSVYSNTKLACEYAIEDSGLDYVIFRYFNLAGADEELGENHMPETHLIPRILQNLNNFLVYGNDYSTPDGTCIRDYVHVLDVVDAHIKALEIDGQQLINLGSGTGHSVFEIIDVIEKVTGQKVKYEIAPRRKGDPSRLVADISLAKEKLNYEPKHNIESIVRSAYEFEKKRNRR